MRSQYWLTPSVIGVAGMAYAAFTGLSLKIGDEIQPPGGVVQMKVFLTEPKPISTGKGKLALAQSVATDVENVSLISTAGDAVGAAVVHGTHVQLVCIVPSSSLGQNVDFPILTLTGRVSSTAAIGSSTQLAINPRNLVFLDPMGVPYPEEIKPGTLTIADNISITDVNPGSITVPAGGTIIIQGLNFVPTTTVLIKEANVSSIEYVSSTELHVTVSTAVTMQGREVTVTNPDGTFTTYYSFQRTTPVGKTASVLFRATLPVFANMFWNSASFALPVDSGTTYSGLALQNLQPAPVGVSVSLVAANGGTLGKRLVSLAPNTRLTKKMVELVSTPPPAGSSWLVRSNAPVQMLGLNGDDSTGIVTPILPVTAQ